MTSVDSILTAYDEVSQGNCDRAIKLGLMDDSQSPAEGLLQIREKLRSYIEIMGIFDGEQGFVGEEEAQRTLQVLAAAGQDNQHRRKAA